MKRQRIFVEEIMKTKSSMKSTVLIKINIAFLIFFFLTYVVVLIDPSWFYSGDAASLIGCPLQDCHFHKVVIGDNRTVNDLVPEFVTNGLKKTSKIAVVNVEEDWVEIGQPVNVRFDRVSANFVWKDIFPEWIDEEEDGEGPMCPEIPKPDYDAYDEVDLVVVKIPCRYPESGWARDVFRLQVHLVAAEMAVRKGRRDRNGKVRIAVRSECRPMLEIFRCDDVVGNDGGWWVFAVDGRRLEEKVSLPVGSCKLALPLWEEGQVHQKFDHSKFNYPAHPGRREAYATVIHSSDRYVCGAIILAQSILKTGTGRDLLLLHDASIPADKLQALSAAGWKLRLIKRIRNPHAKKGSYNEYNYSKLRLWQLTSYYKIVFVDSDVVVLRNLDLLFHFPQLSASGNDGVIFNSGVMVIEPSKCTFRSLLERRHEIFSYNGGDQGFLNEAFVWWHRLPRRVNFLKNFWANTTVEAATKNYLFGSDPPKLYAIHYLGLKPWRCYRDYDCNWDIGDQRVYASDIAHRRWWVFHDQMDEGLKAFCRLTERRKIELQWDRKMAGKVGFSDGHWKLNVSDTRRFE